ncbi:hypothetical protein L7E55_06050 [Pelotomaculum isophthalicicum JI]|uniref:Uncharacterized protein n=1 Tax=Pelotomaculum isophthalicicum JI TaxID=947010 RepID=A0A9X4GYK8_9FIRM|nr:hypothetical protein [Pelotomaculum isophthalicicum]MDF9407925.1 hypothetical protein [Pelotomaculum isophthalicicum JI]
MKFRSAFCILSCIIIIHLLFISSINNALANDADKLTINYFIPHTGYRFSYTSLLNNNDKYDYVTTWEESAPGAYKQIFYNKDGSRSYSIYQLNKDTLMGLESGFEIPESEVIVEKNIEGSDLVFQEQTPGGTWLSRYITIDSYNNISEYKCTYKYNGLERINILGHDVQAANILWEKECAAKQQSFYSEWCNIPSVSKGEDWYVEGMGLVKRVYGISHKGSQALSCTVFLTGIFDANNNKIEFYDN